MNFQLGSAHLGDVLMAMPAIRPGDRVCAPQSARVPWLPVEWVDRLDGGVHERPSPGRHRTEGWLEASGRGPVRQRLWSPQPRPLTVIAPCVADERRAWHGWGELLLALPGAVVVGERTRRVDWMVLLSQAHTVICPNTGTAHMADALEVPKVVGLYGGTRLDETGPYWNHQYCIERGSMSDITVDDVLGAVNG